MLDWEKEDSLDMHHCRQYLPPTPHPNFLLNHPATTLLASGWGAEPLAHVLRVLAILLACMTTACFFTVLNVTYGSGSQVRIGPIT